MAGPLCGALPRPLIQRLCARSRSRSPGAESLSPTWPPTHPPTTPAPTPTAHIHPPAHIPQVRKEQSEIDLPILREAMDKVRLGLPHTPLPDGPAKRR